MAFRKDHTTYTLAAHLMIMMINANVLRLLLKKTLICITQYN